MRQSKVTIQYYVYFCLQIYFYQFFIKYLQITERPWRKKKVTKNNLLIKELREHFWNRQLDFLCFLRNVTLVKSEWLINKLLSLLFETLCRNSSRKIVTTFFFRLEPHMCIRRIIKHVVKVSDFVSILPSSVLRSCIRVESAYKR